MNDLEKIRQQLTSDGWREFHDQFSNSGVSLYKRFDTPSRCFYNDDKPGMQAVIYLWDWSRYPQHNGLPVSLEVEIRGSTPFCSYTIKAHSHNAVADTLAEIPKLLSAWEAINHATAAQTY